MSNPNAKHHGLIFQDDSILGILQGRKRQTRRLVMPQPIFQSEVWSWQSKGRGQFTYSDPHNPEEFERFKRFIALPHIARFKIDDLIWVRERWARTQAGNLLFRYEMPSYPIRWKSSLHLQKRDAPIWLRISEIVRVERLLDITEEDARAEGFQDRESFLWGWDSIRKNPEHRTSFNPFVYVLNFKVTSSPLERN